MSTSIGQKIAHYRKTKGMTQEELAESLGVTPQAVSKWENKVSCPDITLLGPLARLFSVTTDELLSVRPIQEVTYVPEEQRKKLDDLLLKIIIDTEEGDKVRINLPMALIKVALEIGIHLPQVSGNEALKNIDLEQILRLVEGGAIGKLVEIESADGDTVYIVVE